MLKTVLVPVTGFAGDAAALETAYLVGRLFDAHLQCLYVHRDWAQIAVMTAPEYWGSGLASAELVTALETEDKLRSEKARQMFAGFCQRRSLPLAEAPPGPHGVSASWRETAGDEVERITNEARFHDLLVLRRAPDTSDLTTSGIGAALLGAGRPVLLAPEQAPENLAPTIAIAWKDSAEAARAVTAAMPLLAKADRIVILSASETGQNATAAIASAQRLAVQLRWHGLMAEAQAVVPGGLPAPDAVLDAARDRGADLLVMGGYGHARVQEWVFGGFTRHVLRESRLPVFLFH